MREREVGGGRSLEIGAGPVWTPGSKGSGPTRPLPFQRVR